MSAHIHYVIACLICEVFFVYIHRKSSNIKQLFGMLFIPVSLYLFTYRYSLLPIRAGLQVYVTSIVCLAFAMFLCSLTFLPRKTNIAKKRVVVLLAIFSFFLISLSYGIPWLVKAFPLDKPDIILFTLFQNNAGTESFVWNLIWNNILNPTLSIYVPLFITFLILSMAVYWSKKTWCMKVFRYKVCLFCGTTIWETFRQLYVVLFLGSFVAFCIVAPRLFFPLIKICNVYMESNKKYDSELYLKEYVFPDSVMIKFPREKKNLIYIMLESMEVNFKDYTPEINEISKENVSFLPGGVDVAMTGWTIAAQVSKNCGIPLYVPNGLENSEQIFSFLSNATCLTDILAENDYNQMYVQGSNGDFASTRNFWTQHGVGFFRDFPYYVKKGTVSKKKEILWGLTDKKLYGFLREELDGLALDSLRPFAVYAATIDTHFPEGHVSEGCPISETEKTQYPSVLRCASRQLDSFLQWAKKQSWYENTVIVLAGDHTWDTFTDLLNMPKEEPLYWIDIFINSQKQPPKIERNFSSFDMYPTVLEAMGIEIDGHRLGLGTSLFSNEKTLLEKMPKTVLDSLLRIKSYQYDYFMQGGSFVGK